MPQRPVQAVHCTLYRHNASSVSIVLEVKAFVSKLRGVGARQSESGQVLPVQTEHGSSQSLPKTVTFTALSVVSLHVQSGQEMLCSFFVAADVHAADGQIVQRARKVGAEFKSAAICQISKSVRSCLD